MNYFLPVKKHFLFLSVLSFMVSALCAQTDALLDKVPVAYLSYNGEKTGSYKGVIEYSTSFFVKHIVMNESEKQKHIATVLSLSKSFSKLELKDITENKDPNDKGLMVILDLKATDNSDLSNKIKILLNELNIKTVNYLNTNYKIQDFKF